ncbi:Crp/Fnr family transcriptional regulator [Sphingobacterium oryzagri]|uniref:Crp/Fnr family transcriptional regulator n=1 Tax=Sphingobacterium oryzagri TaxID=3025669 RepID=A0ABY7WIJ6_9SPHI|nr:Crp/Fnr family transcriptional regulator [Sphingobacterium sp. KACC 22765]WDF68367.1 Crp/Fnr family transcriptional regulator [Sphingobacterium sp. KACC 22765]
MAKEIVDFFRSIHPISDEALTFLLTHILPVSVKKGKFLRSPIDNTEMIYFVVKGLVRGFIKVDGQDITTWINAEGNMVGSIQNLGVDVETEEYIQALEDATLIAITRESLDEMYATFPEANIIGRKILERYYREADERSFLSRLPSAEKRYKRFAETRGTILSRVTLKYLASYLSMKVETLSRIRSKIAGK